MTNGKAVLSLKRYAEYMGWQLGATKDLSQSNSSVGRDCQITNVRLL